MSLSNASANDLVKFYALGTALPSYGANWQLNFHTADPGLAGVATTNAPTWTGYAAVTVPRDITGWTICDDADPYTANAAGAAFKNAADVFLPECDAGYVGEQDMTWGSLSVVATGQIIAAGALAVPIKVAALIRPYFPVGTLVFKARQ